MKGMTLCAVILAAFLVVAGAFNKAEAMEYTVLGAGNQSCGTWTEDSNKKGAKFYVNSNWLLGFITAINASRPFKQQAGIKNITEGTDIEGLLAWIDNWCRANPLEVISVAAQNLIVELLKRKAIRNRFD